MDEIWVCASEDVIEGGKGIRFPVTAGDEDMTGFVIRYGGVVHGYLNRCAHVPIELDWSPGEFFEGSGFFTVGRGRKNLRRQVRQVKELMWHAKRLVDRLDVGGDFARVAAGPVGSAENDNHGYYLRGKAWLVQLNAARGGRTEKRDGINIYVYCSRQHAGVWFCGILEACFCK